jgi:energy-coupling factor transporter ATP-binding protein EcfA2
MYVKMIKLKNIRGIENLTIKPAALTIISGKNGAGKTSIVQSLIYLGEKSHDPDMIRDFRKGATKGEIVLEIGDNGGEYEGAVFNCTITAEKTTRVLVHPKLGKIPVAKSKEWLESAVSMVSLDPFRILNAKPAEQVQLFLEALPITLTADKLTFLPLEKVRGLDLDKHALKVIGNEKEGIYGEIYDDRKIKNAQAEDKRATARQMTESLPADAPEGNWGDLLMATNEEYRQLQKTTAATLTAIDRESKETKDAANAEHRSHCDAVKKELAEAIERLRTNAQTEMDCSYEGAAEVVNKAEARRLEQRAAAEQDYRPKESDLKEKIGQAKAMVEQHAKAETTRNLIEKLNTEAKKLEGESASMTAQLKKLKELKAELLSSLPIPGLEISEGEILSGGIPLRMENAAEKYRIFFEIGKLKRGPLGFMVMDDAEKFDDENWAAILQAGQASGMQVIAAKRTKGPLAIETEGAA